MQEKLRIYGKCLQNWMVWDDRGKKHITQVELAYTDYDPADGSVIQTGSEDFSLERYKQELTSKYLLYLEWRRPDGRRIPAFCCSRAFSFSESRSAIITSVSKNKISKRKTN